MPSSTVTVLAMQKTTGGIGIVPVIDRRLIGADGDSDG